MKAIFTFTLSYLLYVGYHAAMAAAEILQAHTLP
jgi:hypothetical protein